MHFRWGYRDPPPRVKRYIVDGGTGIALLQRYDDGWRVEVLKREPTHAPFVLTESEEAQQQADERAAQERLEQAAAERARLLEEAKTGARVLGTYQNLETVECPRGRSFER